MPKSITYCTIASANYMPQVVALRDSLARHHHGAKLEVLLCERPDIVRQELTAAAAVRCYAPDELGCDEWLQMAFGYDVCEFNTALKPFFLKKLLSYGADAVVYFDPDIVLFHDLDELDQLVLAHDAVFTPHICHPFDEDGHFPSALDVHRGGQFNMGFCAFRRGDAVLRALDWWADRCRRDCVIDARHGVFVDQSWADLLASFVPDLHVLRSEAYNMAWWNVFQRELRRDGDRWMTGDGPLVFFHYSGLEPDKIERVSRHSTGRGGAPKGSPLYAILADYVRLLEASPCRYYSTFTYSFARFHDGRSITPEQRRKYLHLTDVERRTVGDPFAARAYVDSLVEVPWGSPASAPLPAQLPLRYKLVDKLNYTVKRLPGVHATVKKVMGRLVARRRLGEGLPK